MRHLSELRSAQPGRRYPARPFRRRWFRSGLSIMVILTVRRLLTGGDRDLRPAVARDIDGAPMLAVGVYFLLPAILLVLGLPIFLVLLVTSLVAVCSVADVPTEAMQTYMFGGLDNFPLLAVPFFILAGEIMAQGGIARRVVEWVISLIGGMRGSLAVTTVAASELFGAMAHTAVGTVVAVGRMIYPSLRANGYDERFSVGLIASSGAIAVVIPPSIAMILYSMSAQQSADRAVHRGHLAEPADRPRRCRLCHGLCPHQEGAASRRARAGARSGPRPRRRSGRSAPSSSFSAASTAACSRRPRPPASPWSIRCS